MRSIEDNESLSSGAKLVGLVLARNMDTKSGRSRLLRKTISKKTNLKGGSLRRALVELVRSKVVERIVTGRSSIYIFSTLHRYNCRRVDGPHEDHQTVPIRTITEDDINFFIDGVGPHPSMEPITNLELTEEEKASVIQQSFELGDVEPISLLHYKLMNESGEIGRYQ